MKEMIVICGATATSKTKLAVALAKKLDTEVISADCMLIYKGLDIGTAKPTQEETSGVTHHMIDVAEPTQNFSVSDYKNAALPIVERLEREGKTPIVCGGTGFYIDALLYESAMGGVGANLEVRKKYDALLKENGLEKGAEILHELLRKVDEKSAEVLHKNDVKRVVRALEIYETTGKRKSEQNDEKIPRRPFKAFCVDYPRETLYERIDARADKMFDEGLTDEVNALLVSGVPRDAQCMQGIGYKEVEESLLDGVPLNEAKENVKRHTRNYAKRQITYFKRMANLTRIPHELLESDPSLRFMDEWL